jgi:hypothetical protein
MNNFYYSPISSFSKINLLSPAPARKNNIVTAQYASTKNKNIPEKLLNYQRMLIFTQTIMPLPPVAVNTVPL